MADSEDINRVSRLFTEARYAEAEQLCAAIVARSPSHGRAFYLYGLSCYKNGNTEKAAEQFQRSVLLNRTDFDSLFNLGVAYAELHKFPEAIEAYQSLLTAVPHYIKALPNLGQALIRTGKYDEGIASFNRALAADPRDTRSASLLLEFECLHLPMHERIACCNRTLALDGLSDSNRYTAILYRATAEWAVGDLSALELSLREAAAIKPVTGDQGFINMGVYKTFLTRLLTYRQVNPSLYEGEGRPLYMVGDSHSLTYAGLRIEREGLAHKIESHLIIGAQARHIGSEIADTKQAALSYYMSRLPEGAKLICAFGEIDCRINHGILPYWKSTGGDLEAIVSEVVRKYVSAVTSMASPRSISLTFLSTPAPHAISGNRQQVIALFNKELAARVKEAGHEYIDLYTPTLGNNGVSHGQLHIDSYHLKPEALKLVTGKSGS